MTGTARPVFRFAPSPNGALHLGHAFSALVTDEMARRLGGRFLLRIEDIDPGRCRPDYEAQIYRDLAWLGLTWETPVRRQSEHFDGYAAALERLRAMNVLYPCFATRSEMAAAAAEAGGVPAADPDGAPLYPGLHKHLPQGEAAARIAAGEPHALRLDMDRALALASRKTGGAIAFRSFGDRAGTILHRARPQRWGDVALGRKDVPTSYHLAVVLDDAVQGVTHVTRGRDLFAATDLHRLLQILLDLPEPLYHHHRLISDGSGRKLSKRHGDSSLASLREAGASPADIRAMVGLAAA